jgi:hypothetical protein
LYRALVIVLVAVSAVVLRAGGQQPVAPARESLVSVVGTLVDAAGAPVAGAVVTLEGPSLAGPRRRRTEAQGRFVFRDVPPGSYSLVSEKPGWVEGAYGRAWPGGSPQTLVLGESDRLVDVSLTTWRLAVISGTVRDEAGDPIVWVPVRALQKLAGQPRWRTAATAMTDDRGAFRLALLAPGEYLVVVPSTQSSVPVPSEPVRIGGTTAPNWQGIASMFANAPDALRMTDFARLSPPDRSIAVGRTWLASTVPVASRQEHDAPYVYPTTFYPGSPLAQEATAITLRAGEERAGVDVDLRPAKTYSVSGVVTRGGALVPRTILQLLPAVARSAGTRGRAGAEIRVATTGVDASGAFTFAAVPPGDLVLVAQFYSSPLAIDAWARVPLAVADADVRDVQIQLRESHAFSGRLEFAGSTPPPTGERLENLQVTLEAVNAAEATTANSAVTAGGEFSVPDLAGASYYIRVDSRAVRPWLLDAVIVNGREVTDDAIVVDGEVRDVVIRLVDSASEINGRVTTTAGPDARASVVVFPANVDVSTEMPRRRLAIAGVDRNGSYTVSGLPSGRYFVAAISDERVAAWDSPAFLQSLASRATRVDLNERAKITVPLTPIPR